MLDKNVLRLRWTCEKCNWTWDCDAPGFAGDGRNHFPGFLNEPCGPITAQRIPEREITMKIGEK